MRVDTNVRGSRTVLASMLAASMVAVLLSQPTGTHAQTAPGQFIGEFPAGGGTALVTWTGGSIEEMQTAAPDGASFWVTSDGVFVGLVAGVPDFVSESFRALFPGGQVAAQPIVVVLPRDGEVNFDRTGTLQRNSPGLLPGVWFLNYEAPGAPALTAQLEFTSSSRCSEGGVTIPCADLEAGQRARVRGVETGSVVRVSTLVIEGPTGSLPSIACHTAYRVSVTQPLTEVDTLRVGAADASQSMPYIYLTLHAEYTAGTLDGERSLRLWVTPTADDEVLVQHLYQLPSDSGPTNQFEGGHGFTGLTYAYDPTSGAELQYWCEAE